MKASVACAVRIILVFSLLAFALGSVLAQGAAPTIKCWGGSAEIEGCNVNSRQPFRGFWIVNANGILAQWYPGGDVAGALQLSVGNLNEYHRSLTGNCLQKWSISNVRPRTFVSAVDSGGPWRSAIADVTVELGGDSICWGKPPGSYSEDHRVSAICGEGNSTGLLAGTDNFCYWPLVVSCGIQHSQS